MERFCVSSGLSLFCGKAPSLQEGRLTNLSVLNYFDFSGVWEKRNKGMAIALGLVLSLLWSQKSNKLTS